MSGPTTSDDDADAPTARPLLRIVRGDPTPEEVAALTAVVAAAGSAARSAADPAATGPRSVWIERAALVRRPVHPGPGAWRASALPR